MCQLYNSMLIFKLFKFNGNILRGQDAWVWVLVSWVPAEINDELFIFSRFVNRTYNCP